ncbi:hypothetical protein EGJ27_17855 [Pseudomonas sp. v388]|uniref:hypothetical protein n=1 Tax=Pseudomonas sp. v388 TaxID=2479849 RepID=UPI000F7A1C55|nr:hypothetical protein [Pseudomonas sp. v388]RRV05673.1 hypothetical protein EGJ27_17855 [Pseudomonas sp. v388]
MTHSHKIQPSAPSVPVADDDGLIKNSDLFTEIAVLILPDNNVNPGDSYELTVNNLPTGISYTVPASGLDDNPIRLTIQPDYFLSGGCYAIGYRWKTFPGGVHIESKPFIVRTDRNAPGATLLAPIGFAQINFGETLRGTVPGYAGMEPGDVIQTVCNGTEGPKVVVTTEDLTERPVRISFERAFLESLDSENIRISYHVTDRAGNRSIESQAVDLTYQGHAVIN